MRNTEPQSDRRDPSGPEEVSDPEVAVSTPYCLVVTQKALDEFSAWEVELLQEFITGRSFYREIYVHQCGTEPTYNELQLFSNKSWTVISNFLNVDYNISQSLRRAYKVKFILKLFEEGYLAIVVQSQKQLAADESISEQRASLVVADALSSCDCVSSTQILILKAILEGFVLDEEISSRINFAVSTVKENITILNNTFLGKVLNKEGKRRKRDKIMLLIVLIEKGYIIAVPASEVEDQRRDFQ